MIGRVRTFAQSAARVRTWPLLLDFSVFCGVIGIFYALSMVTRYWLTPQVAEAAIDLSPRALPVYAFYSLVRMAVAYVLSMIFALAYGYLAAYNKRLEALLIAILDVLQSIPVLSFLPGVMLAMVALFPTRQLGLELGSILLIFTGMVWNMAFSFYSSLKAIPRELREASRIYGFSPVQRFVELELPFSAIGLVWNSMVSVAGGWFALMLCEMFVLQNRDFRLPGLGSYLKTAADAGDGHAMAWGLAALIALIVLLDQLLWRPLISWSDKFKFEQTEAAEAPRSPLVAMLFNSTALRMVRRRVVRPLKEQAILYVGRHHSRARQAAPSAPSKSGKRITVAAILGSAALVIFILGKTGAALSGLTSAEWTGTLHAAAATLLRVAVSLIIALLWTIPAGVAIGFHPRLARYAQPFAQIAASVPATALFPILLIGIMAMGGGMNTASVILMLLGTQWYILFNVIAGALAIPTDMREVAGVFRFTLRERWMTVILPGIFPYLVTGLVTASGGAWNASIVAEYFHANNYTYSTIGLGAQISLASDTGNNRLLLISTVVMAVMVVTINRLLWKPLFRLSERRYKLDG